jgi:uncharacterized membrane protein YqjE
LSPVDSEEPRSGTARPPGLLALIRHFGANVVELVHTRVELLTTEVEEELQRGVNILLSMMMALVFAGLFVMMLAVTILIVFWDDHRVLVASLITLVFLVAAVVTGYFAQLRVRQKPRFMAASIDELKRDRASLERKL